MRRHNFVIYKPRDDAVYLMPPIAASGWRGEAGKGGREVTGGRGRRKGE